MKPKLRTLLLALIAIASLAGFALLLFTAGKPVQQLPLPNPNGYDAIVQAGEMLKNDPSDFVELRDMTEDDLRKAYTTTAFAKHGAALALARRGLHQESRVPLDYSATSATKLIELSAVKRLAYAFIAQGRLAEIENRGADAAEAYLDLIRLGHESARGGVVLDSMNGRTVEALGFAYLGKLVPKLNAKSCHEMTSALEAVDERSESSETILRQEKVWARRTYGVRGQITRLLTYRSLKQSEQKWSTRITSQQNQRRLLIVNLAVRAYEQETGLRPKTLADLMPIYLKTVPQDLLIGTNIFPSP